jgi:acetylornithine deacetylase/succinyl-diaminopimelate desuccinylase-like protein
MRENALTYARAHRAETLAGLQALLRIPSISTLPEHAADMAQAAQWLAGKMAEIGLQNIRLLTTPGHPIVYADWLQAGPHAPTLLIYGHYDVQPVDPLEEWLTPPFEPTIQGDNLYGRGAADDKGQLYTHLAAVEAYLKSSGRLPLNIKFMLEGEEECGSVYLEDFVREHQALLQTDAALISDLPMLDPDTPLLVTGVRGLVYLEITLRGPRQDLHSGLYGGVVENPLNALARLLAALQDGSGRVTIPGFYDTVRALTSAERAALHNGASAEESLLAVTGVPVLWGEPGYSPAERIGARPTLDIHGIKGGFTGQGSKTVIPATAGAKVSMRLAPEQRPQEITQLVTDYIRQLCPKTMELSLEVLATDEAAVVDHTAPALEAAAQAYEQAFGRRPLYHREGASIPVVAMFGDILNVPVVLMGFGLPDDNLHAPNEKFYLPNFYRGIETAIHYYNIFGRSGRAT